MTARLIFLVRIFAVAALLHWGPCGAAERLRVYGADVAQTSVSGVSSGGYMAVQFHVANSRVVMGVGVLAAGPYYCAQGSLYLALTRCMAPWEATPLPPIARLKRFAQVFEATGGIDPLAGIASSRVWLFSGTRDETVTREVVSALRDWYRAVARELNPVMVTGVPAGHAMVTPDYGGACETTREPFINACRYDAAGALLAHIYGPLTPPGPDAPGKLIRFEQREFAPRPPYTISMDEDGFAFVPDACLGAQCRVHIAFHGCGQATESIGEEFALHAGYNRWAAANRLIVLYPQAIARFGAGWHGGIFSFVLNPRGCWDWWGYTGQGYATRAGAQMRAVRAMLERLASPSRAATSAESNRKR